MDMFAKIYVKSFFFFFFFWGGGGVLSDGQCEFSGHSGQYQQSNKKHSSLKCHQSLGQTQNPKNLIGNPIPPEVLSEVVKLVSDMSSTVFLKQGLGVP